jgi:hypothetical protein
MFGITVVKRPYEDTKMVKSAMESIIPYLKPGDVINIGASVDKWSDIAHSFAFRLIINHQRYIFGYMSPHKDIHTALYLDKDNLCSVEPPRACFRHLRDWCLEELTILRYTKFEFRDEDIIAMRDIYKEIWGTKYAISQLLNIMINRIMGYPNQDKINFFKKGIVCSVGVRTVLEKWRKIYNKNRPPETPKLPKLFRTISNRISTIEGNHIHSEYFAEERTDGGEPRSGVDIEMTSPAHFANSSFFDNEFKLIARFNNGKLI